MQVHRAAGARGRGQSTVEMALMFPVFLLVLLGIIEFSRAFYAYSVVSNAAREGARYGIMHPTWVDSDDNGDPNNIEFRARRLTTGLQASNLTITTTFPDTTRTSGDRVKVEVVYQLVLILPVDQLISAQGVRLGSSSIMRIE